MPAFVVYVMLLDLPLDHLQHPAGVQKSITYFDLGHRSSDMACSLYGVLQQLVPSFIRRDHFSRLSVTQSSKQTTVSHWTEGTS